MANLVLVYVCWITLVFSIITSPYNVAWTKPGERIHQIQRAEPFLKNQAVKKFPEYYGTRKPIYRFHKIRRLCLSCTRLIQSASSHTIPFNIHFIIILPYTEYFPIYFLHVSLSKFCIHFSPSCACHMPRLSYASSFDHHNSGVFDVKCKSCSSSFHFLHPPVASSVFR